MDVRPVPGTVVRALVDGVVRWGVVMWYEMQWGGNVFPVRFEDGVWRVMLAADVAVVAAFGRVAG